MFPTKADLEFWNSKKKPSWVKLIPTPKFGMPNQPLLDRAINSHGEKDRRDDSYHLNNFFVMMRGWRKQGILVEKLKELSEDTPSRTRHGIRVSFAKRWIKRIT